MMSEETTNTPITTDAGVTAPAAGIDAKPAAAEGASRPLPEDAMIILPVRNLVLFPGVILPITIGREMSRAAAQEAARSQRPLGILLQSKPDVDKPGP